MGIQFVRKKDVKIVKIWQKVESTEIFSMKKNEKNVIFYKKVHFLAKKRHFLTKKSQKNGKKIRTDLTRFDSNFNNKLINIEININKYL